MWIKKIAIDSFEGADEDKVIARGWDITDNVRREVRLEAEEVLGNMESYVYKRGELCFYDDKGNKYRVYEAKSTSCTLDDVIYPRLREEGDSDVRKSTLDLFKRCFNEE